MKIDPVPEGLDGGDDARDKLFTRQNLEVNRQGVDGTPTEIPQKPALALEEDPQPLGDGEDDLAVGDIEEESLPHPLAPFLEAFGVLSLVLVAILCLRAQQLGGGGEAYPNLKTNVASLAKWQDMRFGLFIHWGPVTLRGTEIGWSRGTQVPVADYDSLYKEFNPVLFTAREWVAAAKSAGVKYLVITTKHHDGFSLWDSRQIDYDIMSTPFHRDVVKELSEECIHQGIVFGTYYSILDWRHPYYTTRHGDDPRPVRAADMPLYIDYLKKQVAELVQTYKIRILWFDGQWEDSWTHKDGMDLYA